MKILVIGATGMAGYALVDEFVRRDHEVVAMVRDEAKAKDRVSASARLWVVDDIFEIEKKDLEGFDVIVNAFATSPQKAYLHVDLVARLVSFFRETQQPRLFFILGAGSLVDPEGHLLLEQLEKLPGAERWVSIPVNAYKALLFLREVDNVNWTGISPSQDFVEGDRYEYRVSENDLLFSHDGKSHVTNRTLARAIADEIEQPQFINKRFSVVDA